MKCIKKRIFIQISASATDNEAIIERNDKHKTTMYNKVTLSSLKRLSDFVDKMSQNHKTIKNYLPKDYIVAYVWLRKGSYEN